MGGVRKQGRGRSGHCPVSAASGGGESERALGLHCSCCFARAGGGLRSLPAPPHGTSLWLGAAVGAAEGAGSSLLPRGPLFTRTPLLLSSPPSPLRASPGPPPSPQAEWCGPPPADRPGIPARSPGLAPARAPAPSPSPRPKPPSVAAAASFQRGPGPAAATAAAAELRRRRRRAPWETPGASAAKRPVCRLAVPAASGGPARL